MNMILAVAWPFNKIQEWSEEVVTDAINGIINLVELMFAETSINDGLISQTFEATQKVALLLIILLSMKHILNTYILETDGDSDSDPMLVLVRNSRAMLVISAGALITNLAIKWSDSLCGFITGASTYTADYGWLAFSLISNFVSKGWFMIGFAVVFVIFLLVYCFVAMIRAIELGVMKIILPIMACDLTTIRQDKWNNFFASFIVVTFGYIIQITLLKLAMTYALQGDMKSMAYSVGCLYFGIKTPDWLKKHAYSSGLKDTARSGMYMGMMIGRRI